MAEIFSFIAEDSVRAARSTIIRFHGAFATLAKMPAIGRDRGDLSPTARSFPVGNYIIYYRELRNSIEISRVLHGKREQRKTLNG